MSENNSLAPINQATLVCNGFSGFERYLESFGLPVDNVIASPEEQNRIVQALPEYLTNLPPELKKDARYLCSA